MGGLVGVRRRRFQDDVFEAVQAFVDSAVSVWGTRSVFFANVLSRRMRLQHGHLVSATARASIRQL